EFVGAFRSAVERLGVAEWVTLVCFPEGSRDDLPGRAEHHGLGPAELRARARDALLVNLANSVTVPLRAGFARTALFDVDPGPFPSGTGGGSPIPAWWRARRRRSAATSRARAAS